MNFKIFKLFLAGASFLSALPSNIEAIRESYQRPPSLWEAPNIDAGVSFHELAPLPLSPPFPPNNPYSKQKVALGKELFNDPRLSLSGQISCASCHKKEFGYADNVRFSLGHNAQKGRRNAQSVLMSAFGEEKFWDGRAKNLEVQALGPIADPTEMAMPLQKLAERLNADKHYQKAFYKVFKTTPITLEQIGRAIATYERTLMPKRTRFDKFLLGDKNALSDEEVYGLHLFRTKARCINCHNGVALSDGKFHNLGLSYYGRKYQDLGRYEVSKNPDDIGKFKTPSLRGVSQSAPYMHNGLFPSLRRVIYGYNAGMFRPKPPRGVDPRDPLFPQTSPLLLELHLNDEEVRAIEAFLKTL
ncbi:cytochrome c peroxidase [Helicobacter sp. 11S02596-1]|uniref:cytochrome-c peroxidase n=1 Tax=Helicobacter sp. 11S02596-1 TaxID=1476194 RepID=UPI000BA7C888|nr:cytochrome c peroxidase [Helicobacter sp. 11S02596-1]PAF42508.1 cytochrome-c peroxidase [Helicobacter sp. 11S02596-1]